MAFSVPRDGSSYEQVGEWRVPRYEPWFPGSAWEPRSARVCLAAWRRDEARRSLAELRAQAGVWARVIRNSSLATRRSPLAHCRGLFHVLQNIRAFEKLLLGHVLGDFEHLTAFGTLAAHAQTRDGHPHAMAARRIVTMIECVTHDVLSLK